MKMNDNVKTETLFLNVTSKSTTRETSTRTEKLLTFYFIKYRLLYLQFEF